MSCLGRCSKQPSHNILLNRSIVHAIRLNVSEVPCSGVVSAHTLCAAPECRQCSLCASMNRRCSKINLCICTSVYKFNIDELLLKLLAKRGSLTYFMYLPVQASRGVRDAAVCARAVHTEQNTTRMY